MLCFRDMTFCAYKDCAKFGECSRAFTDKVKKDADAWWKGGPVSLYASKPECYTDQNN